MTSDKPTSFGRRFEYLTAVQHHWPKVLASLYRDAFPIYRACLSQEETSPALQSLAGLTTALHDGTSPALKTVASALQKWAHSHEIQDLWILDAAIQSMHNWGHGVLLNQWTYIPEELDTPRFQPSLGCWIPALLSWKEFKKATDASYNQEAARYRGHVQILWGAGAPKLTQHAVWTVLWQQGKSPEAIRNWHLKTNGTKVSLTSIQLGVRSFAESAGLTLRKPKAGRHAKGM